MDVAVPRTNVNNDTTPPHQNSLSPSSVFSSQSQSSPPNPLLQQQQSNNNDFSNLPSSFNKYDYEQQQQQQQHNNNNISTNNVSFDSQPDDVGKKSSSKASTKDGAASSNMPRAALACHRCREKRARCSAERPACSKCVQAKAECIYPAGRKRKRTRKEMEIARAAAAAAATSSSNPNEKQSPPNQNDLSKPRSETGDSVNSTISTTTTANTTQQAMDIVMNNNNPDQFPPPPPHPQQQQQQQSPFPYNIPPNANDNSTSNFNNPASFPIQIPQQYTWPPPHPQIQQFSPTSDFNLPSGAGFDNNFLTNSANDNTYQHPTDSMMKALESQVYFVDGDPQKHDNLELFYYRFSGSTAIHPGIHRISLKLQPRNTKAPKNTSSAPVPGLSSLSISPSADPSRQMFDDSGSPTPAYYGPLIDLFFRNLCQHFPSVSKKRILERFETKTMSAFYLNCVCAVSARFNGDGVENTAHACAPFIGKAQELIIPLLHLPALDVVTGLLLLAWACYGQNSESGLWQYSGMAFRMSTDLGVHEVSEIFESESHLLRTKLLFWSLFVTDRVLAFATGRPCTIPEETIEIPLPTDQDFFPDPSSTDPSVNEPLEPVPFPQVVRLMVLCGRISNLVNGRKGKPRTLVSTPEPSLEGLGELQTQLVHFYQNLPEPLCWSVDAFKHQEARGHGGSFLFLHLWANAVLAFIYYPDLLLSNLGQDLSSVKGVKKSRALSLACSRTISECLVIADLFASQTYTATPFIAQPLHVASLAFVDEIKRNSDHDPLASNHNATQQQNQGDQMDLKTSDDDSISAPSPAAFMTSLARQNLSVLLRALKRIQHYWAGAGFVLDVLEKHAADVGQSSSNKDSRINTFISLPDEGLLRRFTDRGSLPHNTAPATETSLEESKREAKGSVTQFTIDELLSGYIVEDLLVAPATSQDLEHLASGNN